MLANTVLIGYRCRGAGDLGAELCQLQQPRRPPGTQQGACIRVFLILSLLLIPPLGPLGAAIAIVASDLLVQFGLLTLVIMARRSKHPLPHVVFLAAVMIAITLGGWALGMAIRAAMPGTGLSRFIAECAAWLLVAGVAASPLLLRSVRDRLSAAIPR